MNDNTIKCELCGLECKMQVPATHLRAAHGMTTKEYRKLGYQTLSPARLAQLRNSPVGRREVTGACGKFGPDHPNWKGGHIAGNGYKVIRKMGGKPQYEHRVIIEQMLGRPLAPDEVVHHKDGNRLNNDPDNLVVMTKREHDSLQPEHKRRMQIYPECERAAHILASHGWNNAQIARAIRVEPSVIADWLSKPS